MSPAPVTTRPHVVVIGGGIAGLAAALEVVQALPSAAVTVLEGRDRVGGMLRLQPVGGHLVDVGAESLLATRPEAVDLVRRVGLPAADVLAPATTSAQVWSRGALQPFPRATLMGVPTDPQAARGVLTPEEVARATAERDWPGGALHEDVAVGEYVRARLGPAVVDRLVEPLLGGVYAGHADRLSLESTMPLLWTRARRGESLLTPAPETVPGPDGAPRPVFVGVRGGVARIAGALEQHLRSRGVQLRTGALVRELHRSGQRWRIVIGSAAAPAQVAADAVILAVPAPAASRLLAEVAPLASRRLGEVEVASMAVVTLAVRRESMPQVPGAGFLVPPLEGRGIKAATFSFAKWAWVGDLSPEVLHLRASLGRAGEAAVLQRDDADLVALATAEVGEALGTPLPRVVDHHVQRWGGGLPQYAVGHRARVAAIRADLARLPGLAVAGATYEGVGVPAVIASATHAVGAVTHHLTTLAALPGEHR